MMVVNCGSSTNLETPGDGGTAGDGGPGSDGGKILLTPPLKHLPAGSTCRSTRPAGMNFDDGGKTCDPDAGTFCSCGSDSRVHRWQQRTLHHERKRRTALHLRPMRLERRLHRCE